jgi:hypothetical protein
MHDGISFDKILPKNKWVILGQERVKNLRLGQEVK